MHIRAERDDLADVLSRAARAVGTRSPIDALQGVFCEVSGKKLRVTGSDLEMTVRTALDVEVKEEGTVLIPARLASDAVRKLPEGAVTVKTEDGEVEITGNGPSIRLRQLSVDDYPHIETGEDVAGAEVSGAELVDAINQVVIAASGDDARPMLTGVKIEPIDGGIRMAATDSYRLAVRDLLGTELPDGGLVPARGLKELARTVNDDKVRLSIGPRMATVSSDRGSLTVRLIEATFPNYQQLLPESYPNSLTVKKGDLLAAIDRASLVAEDHIPVRLDVGDGGVTVSVTRQEVGGTSERVEGTFSGEPFQIAFNPRYLADGITAVDDDEVVLDAQDGHKAGILRGANTPGFTYLLMPVRL